MKTRRNQMKSIGRLLKRADFLRVQKSGQKWVTPTCIIQMAGPDDPGVDSERVPPAYACRYGMTVTKKIWKNAVDRNRARRRVRAVFLGVLAAAVAKGKVAPGTDFVVLPRAPSLTAPVEQIEKDLVWAIKRLTTAPEK